MLLEAEPFTGQIQFPSSRRSMIAFTLDSAIEPARDIAPTKERIAVCRVQSRRGHRISGPSGAAAKLRIPPSTLETRIKALKINKQQFKFG
jgi:hypothetical protein